LSCDESVYIDLGFFDELQKKHNAGGDFAVAYVLAHEVGHHVQNRDGTLRKVHNAQGKVGEKDGNALQVKVELQADCYAGLWASNAQKRFNILEAGDIDEALNTAVLSVMIRFKKRLKVTPFQIVLRMEVRLSVLVGLRKVLRVEL